MVIVFDASVCGLGLNGGSKTIIRSAETLQAMGHKVIILASVNRYTWSNIDVPVHQVYLGDVDAVVAVSAQDVEHSLTIPAKTHSWWIRGWELWNMPEPRLLERARMVKCIANTSWICEHLNRHGIDCELCFAGLDLDIWGDIWGDDIIFGWQVEFGYLKHSRHKTKNSQVAIDIVDRIGGMSQFIDSTKSNHDYDNMRIFYNSCEIWLATSTLEGFHQVPAEAALCGCLVAGIRHPRSGTGDYLNEDTGILFDSVEDAVDKLQNPDFSKVAVMQEHLRTHIGSREKNMKKFVEVML